MPWHISERGGGAEVQANFLAIELAKRGYKVHYICQTNQKKKINTSDTSQNVTIHWLAPSGKFAWTDQNKYFEKLSVIQAEFVIQRIASNVTYVIGKYCKQNNARFVWICTDNNNPSKAYHRNNLKAKYPLRLTNFPKFLLFWVNACLMDYFRNQGMRMVDTAFTQNNVQEKKLKKNFQKTSQRMISGHPKPEKVASAAEKFQKKTILWAANWGSHKRPELFMELASNFLGTNLRFIMLGGHSNEAYVKNLLKKCPANVQVMGQLSFDEALEHFDQASLLVNTSTAEGFSNTYIQSWLRGVPTLVFGADPDDMINKHVLGYSVSSVKEAQERILWLFEEEGNYSICSTNALKYANEHFTVEKMAENFLKKLAHEGITLH
jgi:glycosyltransferase involved in cell wall biosynthesis